MKKTTEQKNAELKAYNLLTDARNILAPFADKTDAELGADQDLGKIWDDIREVKLRLMRRLISTGVLIPEKKL